MRLDYLQRSPDVAALLAKERPTETGGVVPRVAVVVTCRRKPDGGGWSFSEEQRLTTLRTAIANGAEFVDLEEDIAGKIPRYGKTMRIVSYHNYLSTPSDRELDAIHARLTELDADIVKIATMAREPSDNLRIFGLLMRHGRKKATAAFCMGEIGIPSRILCGRYGSVMTYCSGNAERLLAPGQLTWNDMVHVYHYEKIRLSTEICGVIGDPIGHSLSPVIHNTAFHELGMNRVYIPFRILPADLNSFMREVVPELKIRGISVTVPHKEAIIEYLDRYDGAAQEIGAVNTVLIEGSGRTGVNTDYRGIMESVEEGCRKRWNPENPLEGRRILVMGAGGVSRAICYGLARRRAKVTVANRTLRRAQELAAKFGLEVVDWDKRNQGEYDMIVNATPIGMHPNVNDTPYQADWLNPAMVVFDTVYTPENTMLIKNAQRRGCTTITGVDMFVRQAALQFRYFTQHNAPLDVMRDAIRRATSAVRY
ncbi:MAG: shikimate dehydrogenase [Planctomycetia bacterium]|nr:shikimate dehydrogenase [Planctomycetia bacterium]